MGKRKDGLCSKCGQKNDNANCAYCHVCNNEYQKKWYKKHPGSTARSHKTRQKFRRDYIKAKKENKPCADCGQIYPWYVMDFDHVRGEKKFNLSIVGSMICSVEKMDKEMAKCEIVCANCHRCRTFTRKQGNYVPMSANREANAL